MLGLLKLLVKLFGPVQLHVVVPVDVVLALKFRVDPLHKGDTDNIVGVAGGVGSVNVNGPAGAEGHPFKVTTTLLYDPAGIAEIVRTPDPFAVTEGSVTAPDGPV